MKAALVLLCAVAVMVSAIVPAEMSLELLEPEEAAMMAKRDPLQYGCSGDLGLVYASSNLKKKPATGCGYAQYNPKTPNGTLNLVKCVSSICTDVNSGFKGRAAVAYNIKLSRAEYFHTGVGATVWAILPTSGAQTPFAPLPTDRNVLVGLELLGPTLYLITQNQFYRAATNGTYPPQLTSFGQPINLPLALKLSPDSFVTGDGVDQLYFISDLTTEVFTYNVSSGLLSNSLLNIPFDKLQQLFYSKEAGLILAADDILYSVDATTGDAVALTNLPKDANGATLSTTNYWYATNTTMTKYDIKTTNSTTKPICGSPIIGNFVYIS